MFNNIHCTDTLQHIHSPPRQCAGLRGEQATYCLRTRGIGTGCQDRAAGGAVSFGIMEVQGPESWRHHRGCWYSWPVPSQ